ncbi:MAG: 4-hydroxy-tetrahydrodipicolinate reductase [Phycisphaerae bacterium]
MIKLGITGAGGRMGKRIAALAIESGRFDIVAATEAKGHPALGKDVGEQAGVGTFGLKITRDFEDDPEVVIDFSLPEGTMEIMPLCREKGIKMIIGTTGLTESQQAELADTAGDIAIVHAGNYSMGINTILKAVAMVAETLGESYDIEVSETHHRFKQDAPSGTAIMLAKAACEALGKEYGDVACLGRGGRQPRKEGEIGIHALRVGDTVGEHTVFFGNLGETVTIGHSAHTRDTFVRGALRAAGWIMDQKPGLYDMQDVLGLK